MTSSEIIDILKPLDYDENPEKYKLLSIVIVSDTHKNHEKLNIPDGDIFLHCGDFTNKGDWRNLKDDEEIPQSIINFNQWLAKLKHKYKIVICGNHELGFEKFSKEDIQLKLLNNCIYLTDELIQIEGLNIYGCSWKFNKDCQIDYSLIPSNIDILMTHIPPKYILDLAYQSKENSSIEPCLMCNNIVHGSYEHWGSQNLINEIHQRIKPTIHCFGHVHDNNGYKYNQDQCRTLFINASTNLTRQYFKLHFYIRL